MLHIHGLNKTTLLDYPGRIGATVFLGGCNFRCPFCHNGGLVLDQKAQPIIPEEDFWNFLERRKGVLQGVCISGGEPTLQPELGGWIARIKAMGYPVKLDTNGYHPEVLESLMEEKLIDYIAMDIKGSPLNYEQCSGISQLDLEPVLRSVQLIMNSGIDYEFRTTVVKELHRVEEFREIGFMLKGAENYFLQNYQDGENVICPGFHAMEKEQLLRCAEIVREYVRYVEIRGIEVN